ncbi:MAG: TolC family protein [Ignavibacteriaceae bacterium]|nr:TolC family protein [Ignavibacteriaceae bacterium]
MKKLISLKIVIFFLSTFSAVGLAQPDNVLEQYIREGLKNNITLQQKNVSYEKALYSLRSATSLFFPSIELQASYTSGDGGRSIDIPVGDLMNPVYQTLNQLTGTNTFPQIQNVKENLFPNQFYDFHLRTSMPILNTDIIFNREIESSQLQIKEYEIDLYKRELIKEIKVAYYNYLSSLEAIKIYQSSLGLAKEGKRVNETLVKNGAGLPVYILRSESEIENINSLLNEAEKKSKSAKKYFNFLLNRNLDDSVIVDLSDTIDLEIHPKFFSTNSREELKILTSSVEINKSVLSMNKLYWIPKISGFVDLGAQDTRWNFDKDSRYYLFGFQLDFPVFEGFRNSNKVEMAELELRNAELELKKINNAIDLSIQTARNELENSLQNYESSLKQLKAAQGYYGLINKGYQEGINSFIETIDARNQLTTTQILVNINKLKVHIARANYERETVLSNIYFE